MKTYSTTLLFCLFATVSGVCQTPHYDSPAGVLVVSPLHMEQYTTLTKVDSFPIRNTGSGAITVTDISSNSDDVNNGYFEYTTAELPISIPPQGVTWVTVTFNPYLVGVCRRSFTADFVITNSTGTPTTTQVTARGFEIDLHAMIARTYFTIPRSTAVVHVIIDALRDTLGQADISGFIMEITHYHNNCLRVNAAYNTAAGGGLSTKGYITEGGSFAENLIEDSLKDSTHLCGEQGYYELNAANVPGNIAKMSVPGNLIDVQFTTTAVNDTSELQFDLKHFVDRATNGLMEYVNASTSGGFITVGTVGVDEAAMPASSALRCFPNPVSDRSSLQFYLPQFGVTTILVCDVLGRVVLMPVDHQWSAEGLQHVELNMNSLQQGIYFCRVQSSERTESVQVVKY